MFPLHEGQENVQIQHVEISLQNTSALQINEPVMTEQDSDQLQDSDTGNKENQDPDDTIDLDQAGFVVLDSWSNETDQPNSSERSTAERKVIVIQPQLDMEDDLPEQSETPIMAAEIEIPTVVPLPVQEPSVQMNILGNTGIFEIFDSCTMNRRKQKTIMLCLLLLAVIVIFG